MVGPADQLHRAGAGVEGAVIGEVAADLERVGAQVERAGAAPPPPKVQSLVDLIQQAKERIAVEKPEP